MTERASHPAAKVFPLMDDDALHRLADDIAENGLLEPIVLYEDMILDGRNRLRACQLAEVQPRFVEAKLDGQHPIEYVLSKNLKRRQLTTVQLALLAFDLLPLFRERARERQKVGRAGLSLEQERERGYTNEKVAEIVGVGAKTVRQVVSISRADPGVMAALRTGGFDSVRQAAIAAGVAVSEPRVQRSASNRPAVTEWQGVGVGGKDRWDVVMPQVAGYVRWWINRPMDHLDDVERQRRLRELRTIHKGLEALARRLREPVVVADSSEDGVRRAR